VSPADPHHDTLKKGQKAYFGARLHCEYGTQNSTLILATPGAAATVADCKGFVNILPFGQCKSKYHPANQFEDTKMDVAFTLDHSKKGKWPACTPHIRIPWRYGSSKASDVIDKSARCDCQYTGRIRFV
jgi:hypothetical protein